MRVLIIYHSYYKNNTEKIAKAFAKKVKCDLINLGEFKDNSIKIDNYDLIGFGSGVYKESLSPKLKKIAENLNLSGKNVFVFSTSGIGMKFYNKPLIKSLRAKGAIIRGSFACKGSFLAKEFSDNKIFDILGRLSLGHPNAKDFNNAESFMEKLIESVK
ncbi:MAG: flavodoxin [Clostridiales bacterium]|nr:flavodoxin [Clostridiales bacterium]